MKDANKILHDRYLKGHPVRIAKVWLLRQRSRIGHIRFIPFVLSWYGYVRIPKEVVFLSMELEGFIDKLARSKAVHRFEELRFNSQEDADEIKTLCISQLRGQKVLTEFLKSGRLLNKENKE